MDKCTDLKRATVSIPYGLDYKFKKLASQKFKFEKGWYSKAMVEAIDMWLRYNEFILLKEGSQNIGRFLGMQMWEHLKQNLNDNLDLQSPKESIGQILNRFNNKSTYIEDINCQLNNSSLKIYLKTPAIDDNPNKVEDLLTQYLQPITVITRAGIEDITNNRYKINEFKVGTFNKIHLKKVN